MSVTFAPPASPYPSPLRVAFDSRPVRQGRSAGRYARHLLSALRATGTGELVETHAPSRCQVFHSPWLDGALLHCPVPMVVTLRDVIPIKRRGEYLRSRLRFKLRYLAVERAARVIVPSATVAEDALSVLELSDAQVVIIPEAPAPAYRPRSEDELAAVRERYGLPPQYLVWAGDLRTRESRERLAALARAAHDLPIVLVGRSTRWARELPGVQVTGAVGDDELAAIYSGAHALLLTGDDDLGLALAEALACGTPVAAFDFPAVRELPHGRIALTDADDLEGLLREAEALRRPAPAPPTWSWHDAARATWEVYDAAIAAPPAPTAPPARPRGRRRGPSLSETRAARSPDRR